MKIMIIGNGSWGTALSIHFAHFHETTLITRRAKTANDLEMARENLRYLPGITFPTSLHINTLENISELNAPDLIIIATPVAGIRETLLRIKHFGTVPLLIASKGLEQGTGLLPHEIPIALNPSHTKVALFSGPTFAQELAQGYPCAICLATNEIAWGKETTVQLNNSIMRVYLNDDPIGVGIGGAVKNIMAIATGFSDGKKAGQNARAALITRGLAEMTRLALALGASEDTMRGLGTLGDLILTCTGNLSRNRQVGLKLAEGKPLTLILKELGHVAEGINTLQGVLKIAEKNKVEMPITELLSALINNEVPAEKVVETIMSRLPKFE